MDQESNGNGHTNGQTYGWSVVECKYDIPVEEDGEEVMQETFRGYCLRWNGPNYTTYCGRSLSEQPSMQWVSDPYEKIDQAEDACLKKMELIERAPVRALRWIQPKLLTTTHQTGVTPKKIQKQLTQRQQDALSTATEAYKQAGGYGVKNDSDTIALILESVADAMGIKQ